MPSFTIEGTDRETRMATKLVLSAPTGEEALRQARDHDIIPHTMTSDQPDSARPVTHADMIRLVEEIQGLRAQVLSSERMIVHDVGGEFARRVAIGVFMALVLFGILAYCLVSVLGVFSSAAAHGTMRY